MQWRVIINTPPRAVNTLPCPLSSISSLVTRSIPLGMSIPTLDSAAVSSALDQGTAPPHTPATAAITINVPVPWYPQTLEACFAELCLPSRSLSLSVADAVTATSCSAALARQSDPSAAFGALDERQSTSSSIAAPFPAPRSRQLAPSALTSTSVSPSARPNPAKRQRTNSNRPPARTSNRLAATPDPTPTPTPTPTPGLEPAGSAHTITSWERAVLLELTKGGRECIFIRYPAPDFPDRAYDVVERLRRAIVSIPLSASAPSPASATWSSSAPALDVCSTVALLSHQLEILLSEPYDGDESAADSPLIRRLTDAANQVAKQLGQLPSVRASFATQAEDQGGGVRPDPGRGPDTISGGVSPDVRAERRPCWNGIGPGEHVRPDLICSASTLEIKPHLRELRSALGNIVSDLGVRLTIDPETQAVNARTSMDKDISGVAKSWIVQVRLSHSPLSIPSSFSVCSPLPWSLVIGPWIRSEQGREQI